MAEVIRAKGYEPMAKPLKLETAGKSDCAFAMVSNQQFAHVYMPYQIYRKSLTPKEALVKGTLFPELWGVYPIPE